MMYNLNGQPIHKVKSKVYIASWLGNTQDEYGNVINLYGKPEKYMFNVQTLNEQAEMEVFGRKVISSRAISITDKKKYLGKFKEYDLVYVDKVPSRVEPTPTPTPTPTITPTPTVTPTPTPTQPVPTELEYGDDADYYISGVRNQNTSIRLYLTKLTNEQK